MSNDTEQPENVLDLNAAIAEVQKEQQEQAQGAESFFASGAFAMQAIPYNRALTHANFQQRIQRAVNDEKANAGSIKTLCEAFAIFTDAERSASHTAIDEAAVAECKEHGKGGDDTGVQLTNN